MTIKTTVKLLFLSNPVNISRGFLREIHGATIHHNTNYDNYSVHLPIDDELDLWMDSMLIHELFFAHSLSLGMYNGYLLVADITNTASIAALAPIIKYIQTIDQQGLVYRVLLAVPGPHTPETAWAALDPIFGTRHRPPLSTYDPDDPDRVRRALLDHLYQIIESMA